MKSISLYQCEICGAQYKFSNDAEACEKFHIRPRTMGTVEIESARYQPYHEHGASQYPHKITVVMQDGKRIDYRR